MSKRCAEESKDATVKPVSNGIKRRKLTPIVPKQLKIQPVQFQERTLFIQNLVLAFKTIPGHARIDYHRKAIDLEADTAGKCNSRQAYRLAMNVMIRDYKNGKLKLIESTKKEPNVTLEKAYPDLEKLLIPDLFLKKHGYILEVPEPGTLPNFVDCIRCQAKFRRHLIMDPTTCLYHLKRKKRDGAKKRWVHDCCGQEANETLGCTEGKHHVFKLEDTTLMHRTHPFISTENRDGPKNVLGLDCEMGYTSIGYEVIRLTIVDFITNKTVFDKHIKPLGEIIDLNTVFSGVHELDSDALTLQETLDGELKTMINKNSILIGHGLENDLLAMRIVHHKVLDTAIMYPRFDNPRKFALKDLAFQYLSRTIQLGEHDSAEDAITAMDIIKKNLGYI